MPGFGIYAGAADGHRAAISIGTNPHYGGGERRIEAFLLDFAGDLYGKRLTLELWQRLRDEQAFASEAELIAQIDRDVEATRAGPAARLNDRRFAAAAASGGVWNKKRPPNGTSSSAASTAGPSTGSRGTRSRPIPARSAAASAGLRPTAAKRRASRSS